MHGKTVLLSIAMQQLDHIELWLNKKCESEQTRDGYSFAWKKFEDFCTSMGYDARNIVTNWRSISAR
jgi:hypothetical protein